MPSQKHFSAIQNFPRPGIEPGSSAWQAEILTTILSRTMIPNLRRHWYQKKCRLIWRATLDSQPEATPSHSWPGRLDIIGDIGEVRNIGTVRERFGVAIICFVTDIASVVLNGFIHVIGKNFHLGKNYTMLLRRMITSATLGNAIVSNTNILNHDQWTNFLYVALTLIQRLEKQTIHPKPRVARRKLQLFLPLLLSLLHPLGLLLTLPLLLLLLLLILSVTLLLIAKLPPLM